MRRAFRRRIWGSANRELSGVVASRRRKCWPAWSAWRAPRHGHVFVVSSIHASRRSSAHGRERSMSAGRCVWASAPIATSIPSFANSWPSAFIDRGTHGTVGTSHHREGHGTSGPFPDRLLLRRVSRPGQRQLRRADDEQGPGAVRLRVRLRGRHLLPRLFPVRGAVEPVPGTCRRAQVDRADHVHLGPALGRHGVRRRGNELLRRCACCSGSRKPASSRASSST